MLKLASSFSALCLALAYGQTASDVNVPKLTLQHLRFKPRSRRAASTNLPTSSSAKVYWEDESSSASIRQ